MTLFPASTIPTGGASPRSGKAGRWTAYLFSAALLVLSAWSAVEVFPFLTGVPAVTGVYRLEGGTFRVASGDRMLVYDVVGPSKTRRSGAATVDAESNIRLARYDGDPSPSGLDEAVVMAANVRTLWVLASDSERAELSRAMNAFGDAVAHALRAALTSREFESEYRPVIIAAVGRSVSGAWDAPETRQALSELLRVGQPVLDHLTADTLRPVVMRHLQPALWGTVKDNTARLLDIFDGFQFDFGQIERALIAAMHDERVWRDGRDAAELLAGTPQMRALVETFVGAFVGRLLSDEELGAILGRLMSDGRMARHLEILGDPGLALARTTPRALAQLDEKADLNSLAADIFKRQARGLSGHVVVFMPKAVREKVQSIDPLAATPMAWEAARR